MNEKIRNKIRKNGHWVSVSLSVIHTYTLSLSPSFCFIWDVRHNPKESENHSAHLLITVLIFSCINTIKLIELYVKRRSTKRTNECIGIMQLNNIIIGLFYCVDEFFFQTSCCKYYFIFNGICDRKQVYLRANINESKGENETNFVYEKQQ